MQQHREKAQTQNSTYLYNTREKKTRTHHHRGKTPNTKQSIAQEKRPRRRLERTSTVEKPKHKTSPKTQEGRRHNAPPLRKKNRTHTAREKKTRMYHHRGKSQTQNRAYITQERRRLERIAVFCLGFSTVVVRSSRLLSLCFVFGVFHGGGAI
jgi:DNA mismatch repair ATPase MutL